MKKKMKPMTKIKLTLGSFGILMGVVFPIYANLFVEWVPGKTMSFIVGCLVAGVLVAGFSYINIIIILKKIDRYYKVMLFEKLGIEQERDKKNEKDILVAMEQDFEELLDKFDEMTKKEERRLIALSNTDELTKLHNSRAFYETMKKKTENVEMSVSLLFCDIDYFKRINDEFGHVIGDCVLKKIAKTLKDTVPKCSGVFRYGGEEFIVVLEHCSEEKAYEIAQKIRKAVENANILSILSKSISVSISVGVSCFPDHGRTTIELLRKADKAMYFAKNNGRNQCKIYTEEIEERTC